MTTAFTGSLLAYLSVNHQVIDAPATLWRAREGAFTDEPVVEFISSHWLAPLDTTGSEDHTQSRILLHPYGQYVPLPCDRDAPQ